MVSGDTSEISGFISTLENTLVQCGLKVREALSFQRFCNSCRICCDKSEVTPLVGLIGVGLFVGFMEIGVGCTGDGGFCGKVERRDEFFGTLGSAAGSCTLGSAAGLVTGTGGGDGTGEEIGC